MSSLSASMSSPPIANQANGLDVLAGYDATGQRSFENDFTILDTQAGDTVVLAAVGLRLASDNFNQGWAWTTAAPSLFFAAGEAA